SDVTVGWFGRGVVPPPHRADGPTIFFCDHSAITVSPPVHDVAFHALIGHHVIKRGVPSRFPVDGLDHHLPQKGQIVSVKFAEDHLHLPRYSTPTTSTTKTSVSPPRMPACGTPWSPYPNS